jgi:hypothetical protein
MSNPLNSSTSSIETINIVSQLTPSLGQWVPEVGEETINLLSTLDLPDQESRDNLLSEAIAILSRCVPPSAAKGEETGLVIGYVQSGKTMSFTTVTALARDNSYPMVIVIAGTTKPLFQQSEDRLYNDLRLLQRSDRKWKRFSNPKMAARQSIESTLAEWQDSSVPNIEKQTVLITVMKNHTHLNNLNKLLAAMDLNKVPVLIIDDEADQASLNASVNKGDQTTTYRRLVELRQELPHHTFLQYTATPQAPLLINIIDVLSPRFAELLTPGKAYTGGNEFFTGSQSLVRTIPDAEIPSKQNVLTAPPSSLLQAMRIFFLGVAAGYVLDNAKGNRSMMVHPSQKTIPHSEYTSWVRQVRSVWLMILKLDPSAPERQYVLAEFYSAYQDLVQTVKKLPAFDELVSRLERAIRNTIITEVNSKQTAGTPQINWKNDYSHILIGGQAMDRGFTVEGLTVTYMPRGIGEGNADTLQQRARFFGYKKSYLGYCRVYVEDATRDAFRAYIDHEEDIRSRLVDHRNTNKPLSEWKRAFFLAENLKPTRNSVLDLAYVKDNFSDDWFSPKAPHDTPDAVKWNWDVAQQYLATLPLVPDVGHPERTAIQQHNVAINVPLADAFSKLLLQVRMTRAVDSQYFTGLLLQVRRYLENNADAICTVYEMSKGLVRERTVDSNDQVPNLFQGAHPDSKGTIYPGDRNIKKNEQLTIQIHNLTVKTEEGDIPQVAAIAVWVPKVMSNAWLSQEQGGSQ